MAVNLRQKELSEWQIRNFGVETDEHMALGMAEEVGELSHFLLKSKQGIREGNGSNCDKEIGDAFADTVIFGIQLMTLRGMDAEKVLEETLAKVLKRDWVTNPKGIGETQHKQAEKV